MFGDEYVVQPSFARAGRDDLLLRGEPVGLMDGDEYDAVWGGRVTYDDDICDEWVAKDGGQ